MIQSFDTGLTVVARALREVIAPALEGSERHVQEQLQLSLVTLAFIRTRLPHATAFARTDLGRYLALGAKVHALVAGDPLAPRLALAMAEGRAQLDRPGADMLDYELATRQLRETIAAIVAAAVDKSYERALDALIVADSAPALDASRAWVAPFGFEQRRDLPDITAANED